MISKPKYFVRWYNQVNLFLPLHIFYKKIMQTKFSNYTEIIFVIQQNNMQ